MLWMDTLSDLVGSVSQKTLIVSASQLVLGDTTCPPWVWSHETETGRKWIVTLGGVAPNDYDEGTWMMYDSISQSLQIFDASELQ